jgi:thioredoxin 1
VGNVVHLDEATFRGAVKQKLALVDFWAEWCGPCRIMNPVLEELAGELKAKVFIGKVNIDDHPKLAEENAISAVPTILFFSDGKLVDMVVGAVSKESLRKKILETVTA